MAAEIDQRDVRRLAQCVGDGGVAVFPTDTVYGLCCDPENERAAGRLFALKGRPASRPAAVMFFALEPALRGLPELLDSERAALHALLPGPVTLLLANRKRRFAPACAADPATLGLRVPRLPAQLEALSSLSGPVMQSSANISGQPDTRSLPELPRSVLDGVDLVLDGGVLPGTPSTVIDLREYNAARRWRVMREGALSSAAVARMLAAQ